MLGNKVIVVTNSEWGWDCVLGVYLNTEDAIEASLPTWGGIHQTDQAEFDKVGAQKFLEARCYVFSEKEIFKPEQIEESI